MTSTTMLNTLINLKALNAAALSHSDVADGDDYKALVCITLNGGNDAFNMMVPTTGDAPAPMMACVAANALEATVSSTTTSA